MSNNLRSTTIAAAAVAIAVAMLPTLGNAQTVGGFYGKYIVPDGSQATQSRAVAGASPNAAATARGVRCGYMYVVRGGVRYQHYVCD